MNHTPHEQSNAATKSPPKRWRKKALVAAIVIILLAAMAGTGIWFWLRSESFNRIVAEQIKNKLTEFGLRGEIGSFGFTWDSQTARLKDLKIFNQQNGQLIISVTNIEIKTLIHDLYALKSTRDVMIKDIRIDGVEVFIEFDEDGRSNLDGIHAAPPKKQTLRFDYNQLLASLTGGAVHFRDRRHNLETDLSNFEITVKADPQQTAAFDIRLTAPGGRAAFENRESKINRVELAAKASANGIAVDQFKLDSAIAELTAKGRLEEFKEFRYGFDLESNVRLAELSGFAFPNVVMRGLANVSGNIAGESAKYSFKGAIRTNELLVENTRLRGIQIPQVNVSGSAQQINLSGNRVNVQTVGFDQVSINGISAGNFKGKIELKGRQTTAEFMTPAASVASVEWPDSKLSSLSLNAVTSDFRRDSYKVNASASLPGGSISGFEFTGASAKALFDKSALTLTEIKANAFEGTVAADFILPLAKGAASTVKGSFADVQTSGLLTALEFKDAPISGKASGETELSFIGSDGRSINGKISARFDGQANPSADAIPVTGEVSINAENGIFNFERLYLSTGATVLNATGKLSYDGESDLRLALNSSQAEQLIQIARSFETARPFIVENEPQLLGDFKFDGRVSGKIEQAVVEGDVQAATAGLRDGLLGAFSGHIVASATQLRVQNGSIAALNGGSARFNLFAPFDPKSEAGNLDATVDRISLETILAAAGLPDAGDFVSGDISGLANLSGLPGALRGEAKLNLLDGQISGQAASLATADFKFNGRQALLESLNVRLMKSQLTANGSFDLNDFSFQAQGQADQIAMDSIAEAFELKQVKIEGSADAKFQISGQLNRTGQADKQASIKQPELDWESLKIELSAIGKNVKVNGQDTGDLRLTAHTSPGGRLEAELVTGILAAVTNDKSFKPEIVKGSVELRKIGRPISVESDLTELDLTPVIAAFAPDLGSQLRGSISGKLKIEGPTQDSEGNNTYDQLIGGLTLTKVDLELFDNSINFATPMTIALDRSQLKLPQTKITGQGIDLTLGGIIGLQNQAVMNFDLNGLLNLDRMPSPVTDYVLFGEVRIGASLTGNAESPQLGGEIELRGFGVSASDLPVFISNGNGRIKLAGDQLTVEKFAAEANDGTLDINGSMKLDKLKPAEWSFNINARNANIYYDEFSALVGGILTLTGNPERQTLSGTILVPQGEYETRIDLDNLIGGGNANLGFGSFNATTSNSQKSVIPPIYLNLQVDARDSLLVRGEQINAVGSASFTVGGTLNDPDASGRIETESGSVRFRGQRYEITKGTLDLPRGNGDPELNLLAESEISGYRVYLEMKGQIDAIRLDLRAEPQLTRDEIIALITTGRTETGTIGSQAGVGAAASLLSSGFISKPTEQLLGLSRFQIDPVIRPNANPAARLTVGQQLSRNLYLSYSTNLATEQDQTALAEYTFSNRFSGLATYTQGGSAARQGVREGVFTIELRGRQRFSLGFSPPLAPVPVASSGDRAASNKRDKLPPADVSVSEVPNLKLDGKKLRDLLPVMSQGFSRSLARLGERRLKEYLQEQGYFFAEVSYRCLPDDCSGKDLRLRYEIEPNLVYDLKEIRIEGTKLIRHQDIRDELQSQVESPVGGIPFLKDLPLIGGTVRGLTSSSRLKSDEEYIRRYLVDIGFRNSRVRSRLAVKPDNDDLIVIFDVEEGVQSEIADVVLRGNTIITANELRQAVPIQSGEAFSLTRARLGAQAIERLYADRGFLRANAELQIAEQDEDSVRLVYQITEGSRAIISKISISGLSKTGEGWVRRYYDFKVGDVLTPASIAQTQRNLYATNAFREVSIRAEPIGGGDNSEHEVMVNLTEAKPLLFVYGLGYSTDDGARGLMEIANTNLRGSLDALSLRLRGSRREQLAQLAFTDLRPFGTRFPTTISVFYDRNNNLLPFARQRQLLNGRIENVPDRSTFGLNRFAAFIQTERKLDGRTSMRFRYNLERAKLFNIENLPETEITRNERAIRLGMFSAGFTSDSRDNVLNPAQGQLISADHSIAAKVFGGNESFNKFFGTYQRYKTFAPFTPVLGSTTLAFSARIGLAATFRDADRNNDGKISDSEKRLPISERFFSGGATTLRGFRFETAGPQDVVFDEGQVFDPTKPYVLPTLIPVGGDALAIFNFELRYPLTQRLRLVPFYDVGNVFRRVSDFNWPGMTNTIGIGIRINTPLGPVGLDYGFLIDPPGFQVPGLPGAVLRQPRGAIHIRFGQTF